MTVSKIWEFQINSFIFELSLTNSNCIEVLCVFIFDYIFIISCVHFAAVMIFDGKFQVTRGDVFTTGLKYNHTSVYQQKVDFYRNLITESLDHNGLTVYKCEIHGFGTGPLVHVDFRVFLDMRKVPR